MSQCDWSSDVCSSDLGRGHGGPRAAARRAHPRRSAPAARDGRGDPDRKSVV